MSGQLQRELHQTKPFESPAHEMYLNIVRTAFVLQRGGNEPLKAAGISAEQYNVLRILRGAGAGGWSCQEIAERMVSFDPDLTRLIDRLLKRGWVVRERSSTDRRVVISKITAAGLAVLKQLEAPMRESLERLVGHLQQGEMRKLIDLLERVRVGAPS
ncbi:MAG: MarR family winged helix-turn-helix transcriptional regulator [Planctomycetota bacterium]